MNVTVAVYQRKLPGQQTWITLGLGEHTVRRSGLNSLKLRQALVGDLKSLIARLEPRELAAFQMTRGLRLEHVRLELVLRGGGARRKIAGLYPIVLEPRRSTPGTELLVAYHPERQGEWFPVRPELTLQEQAS